MTRIKRWLVVSALVVLALAVGGFLFAWSGIYNVAASRGHWPAVKWMLSFAMSNSVERRALFVDAPRLDDPDMIALGGEHFRTGCAPCHGGGGRIPSPIAQHMLPPPPDLTIVSRRWNDRELFWIVMHGIKYTGMPAWIAQTRDDEVWAVVAYLKTLDSRAATIEKTKVIPPDAKRDTALFAALTCGMCHGGPEGGPVSSLVPMLHGQSPEYLAASLRAYANGERNSGIMQPVAAELSRAEADSLANYYASLTLPPAASRVVSDVELISLGQTLALEGRPQDGIPACESCHGARALAAYPRLSGLTARYIASQLRLWREDRRSLLGASAIMAPIAQRLSDKQIEAVAAFYASDGDDRQGRASQ